MDTQQRINLGFLGFGNVLKHFAALLDEKADRLRQTYGWDFAVVGIATHSHGYAINPKGLDVELALNVDNLAALHVGHPIPDTPTFIQNCPADVILEGTWANPHTGQPATDYCRLALEDGKHVVTANKGPIAFAEKTLSALARERDLGFFYESTVMDGIPLHSLRRESLLATDILSIRGVLNSTTNGILTRMEEGDTFDDALRAMQALGIAEADPTHDIEGWDSALKITILANTMMGADLRPADAHPIGIQGVTPQMIQEAVLEGQTLKLLCEATRAPDGQVSIRVAPTPLAPDDPLAWLDDVASGVTIQTDVLENLTIRESDSGPRATAYGMLVDMLNILRGRR